MSDLRTAVDVMLVRCDAAWNPAVERYVAEAGEDPSGWLRPAAGLLRASWSEGGRPCALAAAALTEYALDIGARDHPQRSRWVLHLWLAERTLAQRFGDHRLSDDVHLHLAAQTQDRAPDDPVRVAATWLEEPLPRHFEPPRPSERHAARLAAELPADDLVRPSLLARLAQAAAFRHESGDEASLVDAERWAYAAFEAVGPDHVEADVVCRTAVHASLTRYRSRPLDDEVVERALRAGRMSLRAVEHARTHGTHEQGGDRAAAHLFFSLALTASLFRTMDEETVEEAIGQLEEFRVHAPPDDMGVYAANMASLLTVRAFLTWSRADVQRSDELWAALQRDLPPLHPLLPHIEQKRAACAELARMMRVMPFNGAALVRMARPLMEPLLRGVQVPPVRMYAPPERPGRRSPGPGPADFAAHLGGPPPTTPGHFTPPTAPPVAEWPPGPPVDAGPEVPATVEDIAELPPQAAAVRRALHGAGATDPRRLALAEVELRELLAGPLTDGRRAWVASVLVHVIAARYPFDSDPEVLAAAVRCGDEQLAKVPPTCARYLELLVAVEMHRQAYGFLHHDVATVGRACDALRWAAGRVPEGSTSWLGCAIPYAQALASVSAMRRDPEGTQEALRITEVAGRALEDLPRAPEWGPELAALREQLRPALAQVRELVRVADDDVVGDPYGGERPSVWDPEAERTLPPLARFENARTALNSALERRDWARATDAAGVALEMLPQIASQALHRDDRQAVLRSALLGRRYPAPAGARRAADLPDQPAGTSLARTACAVALAAGRTERAAALLEQGRAVLMGQDIQARTDVSDLAAAHPEAARAFTELGQRLRESETRAASGPDDAGRIGAQHAATEEWRQLLEQIRKLHGFADFLLPPAAADMRAEAAEGPIVLVNVDRLRSDALVVTAEEIRTVRLDITEGLVAQHARRFLTAVAVGLDAPRGRRAEAAETVFGVLEWLWDAIAEPVLESAGLTEPIPDGTPRDVVPRLWWSASGPLAHLPLHAAGYQRKEALAGRRSVLDRVASSYTPSIRALRHARQVPAVGGGAGPHLAVRRPTGVDGGEGASLDEVAAMARTLTGLRRLEGGEATVERVLAALSSAATVHFACHGVSDPEDPSRSRLELADGPLGVLDVSRRHLPRAQLAVLLACHTARTERLPDEAIHLTSAFQTAGYPQVVGALWEAPDLVSVRLTERLYRSLRAYGGGLDVTDTARAVHGIVRELRAGYAKAPAVWAPYVHTGR
ncbi:CHAT domain-containing protein [Streptomyces sp. NPDC086077]|uniref:CHAT domain-containing protein n=1 Tax=Streptomyces sp. NPDC086077 TaxID=3154862 RepID=UPI0034372CBD